MNRHTATAQLFADEQTLRTEWPAFLKAFSPTIMIQLVNWPDFGDEFTKVTGKDVMTVALKTGNRQQAAFIGDWLVMPLLDTPFRTAIHTGQWRKHSKAA